VFLHIDRGKGGEKKGKKLFRNKKKKKKNEERRVFAASGGGLLHAIEGQTSTQKKSASKGQVLLGILKGETEKGSTRISANKVEGDGAIGGEE